MICPYEEIPTEVVENHWKMNDKFIEKLLYKKYGKKTKPIVSFGNVTIE